MPSSTIAPEQSGYETYIGPVQQVDMGDGAAALGFTIVPHHLNGADMLHGGMMMSFASMVLAAAAREAAGGDVEALSVNCDFTGPGKPGDEVTGIASVTRRTRTIVFLSCDIQVGDRMLMTATGVYRVVTND